MASIYPIAETGETVHNAGKREGGGLRAGRGEEIGRATSRKDTNHGISL